MNREEFEDLLADYLGGELATDDHARFDAYLAAHPEAQQDVDELRATLDELGSLQSVALPVVLPADYAGKSGPASTSASGRYFRGVVKVAALIAFGVIIGRATAPPAPPPPVSPHVPATVASVAPVHPGWIELARHLDAQDAPLAAQLRGLANLPH